MPSVWPYQPEANFTETLEWKSEVLTANSGLQRITLRPEPRVKLSYQFQLPGTGNLSALNTFKENEQIIFPFWHERDEITNVSSGVTSIVLGSTVNKSYRVGGYIYFINSLTSFEAALVTGVSGNTIYFNALGGSYSRCAVMPAHLGELVESFTFSIPSSNEYTVANLRMNFALKYITPLNAFDIYNELPLVDWQSLVISNQHSVNKNRAVFENINGPIAAYAIHPYTETSFPLTLEFDAVSDVISFKSQLNYFKGKLKSFWLPTWTDDFQPSEGIVSGNSYITVNKDFYGRPGFSGHIAVIGKDGSLHPYEVLNRTLETTSTDRLNLNGSINSSLALNEIDKVTTLNRCTLGSDSVIFTYRPGAIQCSLSIITVIE